MKLCIVQLAFLACCVVSLSGAAEVCNDLFPRCPEFKARCHLQYMKKFCPKSCDSCDLCKPTNGGCHQLCATVNRTATCSCFPGFKLSGDGTTCVDINECTEGPNPCNTPLPTYCINSVGSYSCQLDDCASSQPGTMNYYRSDKCCKLNNITGKTCGLTESIRQSGNGIAPRITRGTDASSSSWPWMVQILLDGRHLCGGSLIANQWVVTTASCLNDNPIRSMTVHLGHIRNAFIQFLDNSKSVVRGVAGSLIHSEPELNNIALIQLSEPVTFDDKISPICLPCGELPNEGDKCWATGFGDTVERGDTTTLSSPILQEVDLPIVGIDECIQAYKAQFQRSFVPRGVNRETTICAGYKAGGKDACHGDGGGPLVCQRKNSCEWYLSGITSFGIGCGRAELYGVYTKVAKYELWIKESLGENASGLCTQDYSPCNALKDSRTDCNSIRNLCESDQRHECSFTCCQRKNGLVPSCFDTPGAESACASLKYQCDNPKLKFYLQTHCKATCSYC